MEKRFYSNGKLLLTGEYLVLDGAKALAVPTKFGQDLTVSQKLGRTISWTSYDADGTVWFEDVLSLDEITNKNAAGGPSVRNTLIEILHQAAKLNPEFPGNDGYEVKTRLTFPKFWGLGTSSTLINNIAQWLEIDAYKLLANSFGGSGYDIACAQHDTPIVFHLKNGKPIIEPVAFHPSFSDKLYFVYLNRKQSSKAAIASYYTNRDEDLDEKLQAIDKITENILHVADAGAFSRELQRHEALMSNILEMKTVSESFFSDFDGTVKSLGGWGGDFVLAVSKEDPVRYFQSKGFNTVVRYADMILDG